MHLTMACLLGLARSCNVSQAVRSMACPAEATAARADGVAVDSGASLPIVNAASTEYQMAPADADVISYWTPSKV